MIVKTVVLRCDRDRAFALFTERAGEWWPADRRHSDDASSTIRIEPERFFERPSEGPDVELGIVRRFEPPARIDLDWFPGTGPAAPTRVSVTFESVAEGTLVTVTHDAGAAGIAIYSRNAPRYDRAWDAVLDALAGAAKG